MRAQNQTMKAIGGVKYGVRPSRAVAGLSGPQKGKSEAAVEGGEPPTRPEMEIYYAQREFFSERGSPMTNRLYQPMWMEGHRRSKFFFVVWPIARWKFFDRELWFVKRESFLACPGGP